MCESDFAEHKQLAGSFGSSCSRIILLILNITLNLQLSFSSCMQLWLRVPLRKHEDGEPMYDQALVSVNAFIFHPTKDDASWLQLPM